MRPGPKPRPASERFLAKVQIGAADECWPWLGRKSGRGYGMFAVECRRDRPNFDMGAHRFAYEHFVGPIPEGLVIDHLCRNPVCVNPAHLEPVTQAENILRGEWAQGDSCKRGHDYAEHGYIRPTGARDCRACRHELEAEKLAA